MTEGDRSLAVFVDFENLALGFQPGGSSRRFEIGRVLERLVEKGKIVVKKAYADWHRFSHYTHAMHEAAIELIEIPRRGQSGKNSADIRLCVDAMDLAYSKEHINTFAIISGDSDFSPLVSKLKELGKHVIGLGMQDSTSDLLRDNCDEFIYYEDLGQAPTLAPSIDSHLPDTKRKAFSLLLESLLALRRENKEVLWSSMIKDTMKRKKPSFNETYHGYRTFSELLEDAQKEGILELETDKRSRTYVVTRFGSEMEHGHVPQPGGAPPGGLPSMPSLGGPVGEGMPMPIKKKSRRRRRRGGSGAGLGVGNGNGSGVAAPAAGPGEFRPVVIPPGPAAATSAGPVVPPREPIRPAPRQEASAPPPAPPLPPPAPEPEPAPVAARSVEKPVRETPAPVEKPRAEPEPEPAPPPAPKPRTRTPRTTKTGTTTRTRRSTKASAEKSAAEPPPAESAPPTEPRTK